MSVLGCLHALLQNKKWFCQMTSQKRSQSPTKNGPQPNWKVTKNSIVLQDHGERKCDNRCQNYVQESLKWGCGQILHGATNLWILPNCRGKVSGKCWKSRQCCWKRKNQTLHFYAQRKLRLSKTLVKINWVLEEFCRLRLKFSSFTTRCCIIII